MIQRSNKLEGQFARAAAAVLLACAACATGATDDTSLAKQATPQMPQDITVLQLALSRTHTVKFIETSDGDREMYESLHVDLDRDQRRLAGYTADDVSFDDSGSSADPAGAEKSATGVESTGELSYWDWSADNGY